MHISAEMMDGMADRQRTEYVERLCQELRAESREGLEDLDQCALYGLVSTALDRACMFGLSAGDDIRRYVKLAVFVSPEFDSLPEVQRFLKLADLAPGLKIRMLCDLTAAQIRSKAL